MEGEVKAGLGCCDVMAASANQHCASCPPPPRVNCRVRVYTVLFNRHRLAVEECFFAVRNMPQPLDGPVASTRGQEQPKQETPATAG